MLLSFFAALFMATILNIFPYAFFRMFGQGDDFIAKGIPVLQIVSGAMLMMSISVVWLNSLTGTGQTKINLLTEIIAVTLYMSYTTFIVKVEKLPLAYAWSNEWLYWITTFAIAFIFMNKTKWKKKNV
jgi:MATE family multidrug resistance protein